MTALRSRKSEPTPETARRSPHQFDPDESGIRRVPTAEDDELPDLTDEAVELRVIRKTTPPPIPPAAWAKAPRPAEPATDEAIEDYDDQAVSMLDFDMIAKSCPPKLAGYAQPESEYPSVPGLPAYFYVSTPPAAPKQPFDYELALHVAVVWLTALAGGLLALF